jgi:hydroxymethylbilane synthase
VTRRSKIIIGSRGSALALWQTDFVAGELSGLTSLEIEIKKIKTTGDKILDSPLAKIGDKGLFVKEIEHALEKGQIDLAVHSMKDVPTEIPGGLMLGAILKRELPNDVLVSRGKVLLKDLPPGAIVGTSSLRRKAQLLHFRPDFKFVDVRGNLDTRLRKMASGDFDAMILAAAGIRRLGMTDEISEVVSTELLLPAVGQGAIGIEVRKDDEEILKLVKQLGDRATKVCVLAERALMRRLEGGCQIPIGALGVLKNGSLYLEAMVASLDGSMLVRDRVESDQDLSEQAGVVLAEKLLALGADRILKDVRESG